MKILIEDVKPFLMGSLYHQEGLHTSAREILVNERNLVIQSIESRIPAAFQQAVANLPESWFCYIDRVDVELGSAKAIMFDDPESTVYVEKIPVPCDMVQSLQKTRFSPVADEAYAWLKKRNTAVSDMEKLLKSYTYLDDFMHNHPQYKALCEQTIEQIRHLYMTER